MKLTGKCKEDFFIFFQSERRGTEMGFYELPELFQNALIIEFFDSVGIHIAIQWFLKDWIFSVEKQPFKQHHYKDFGFNSRTEATNAAIEKANNLHNNKL